MRRAIIALSDRLDAVGRTGAIACFVAMLVFVAIQVIARYVLRDPPTWTEELARYAMIWGGLLGATVAFKDRADPVLFQPPSENKPLLRRAAAVIRTAAVVIFLGPLLYFSVFGPEFDLARGFLGRSLTRTADTLGFPMVYITAAVPIAAAVILIHLAARLAGDGITSGANRGPAK